MSDAIKHECGVALIRLRKPYEYYVEKYGTPAYGLNKLYVLMDKQRNRGQDGAGVAVVKLVVPPGYRYISRYRSTSSQAIEKIYKKIGKKFKKFQRDHPEKMGNGRWLKQHLAFTGEVLLGHLRYGTHGLNSIENCHPFLRQNNWRSRNLVVAGNFNMTNVDNLFDKLITLGQHPKEKVDTVTVMEKIGHFLDEEVQRNFDLYKNEYSNEEISGVIETRMDIPRILYRSCRDFDGGYTMVGIFGHGSAFVMRDPSGIRPAYYYADEEVLVVASEKPAIKIAFNVEYEAIQEVKPGHALVITQDGAYAEHEILPALEKRSCSFERIYFSRGSDPHIYEERKKLGRYLVPQVLEAIGGDLENTVFSYIPNTSEVAFLGMIEGLEDHLMNQRKAAILEGKVKGEELDKILSFRPRVEKLVIKDGKSRTFIADDSSRDEMVANVYDTTYEVIRKHQDTLVLIDDSIVRGTTLEKSILRMLDRLEPRKIVIVSSAPQIRYPDCYGIDMSRLKDFVAFRAALKLWEEKGAYDKAYQVLDKCQQDESVACTNFVKELYDAFSPEEISAKITQIVRPKDLKAELAVIYQSIENLQLAIPHHKGDWYFTGNYPTPGGFRVVNKAFINYMQGKLERAY
jgi:amidophosphoribosyltransferase